MATKQINFPQILLIAFAFYVVYLMFFKEPFEALTNEEPVVEPVVEQVAEPAAEPAQPAQPAQPAAEQLPAAAPTPSEKAQISAEDLLPKYDEANEFAKQNPVSDLLKEQNFLISGYHMGVNTVMQSNKLAFHDLRAAPPIPKQNIGPFLQSSYETPAGTNRRSLEIL
jgi:hypothetical protein